MRRFSYTLFDSSWDLCKKTMGVITALLFVSSIGYGQSNPSDDPSPYCNPDHDCTFEDITFFSLANVTNQSECDDNGDVNYYDNTTIDINKGQDYTLSLNATNDESYMAVWVDFDNSGTFDSDEILINTNSQVDDRLSTTVNFDDRPCGDTRLRVMSSQDNQIDPGDACNHPGSGNEDGSVEDYNISIGTPSNPSQDLAIYNVQVTPNQGNANFGDLSFNVSTGINEEIPAGDTIPVTYKTKLQPDPKLVEYVVQEKIEKCSARGITLNKVVSTNCPGANIVTVVNQWGPDNNPNNDTAVTQVGDFTLKRTLLSEGFENGSNGQVPAGWSTTAAGSDNGISDCGANTGNKSLILEGDDGEYIETPEYDLKGGGPVKVEFFYIEGEANAASNCGESPDDGENVLVEYWNGSEYEIATVLVQSGINQWNRASFTVQQPLPADFRVRLRLAPGGGFITGGDSWVFDDFKIQEGSTVQKRAAPSAGVLPQQAYVNSIDEFAFTGKAKNPVWILNGKELNNSGAEYIRTFNDTGKQSFGFVRTGCYFDTVFDEIDVIEPKQKPSANFFTQRNVLCTGDSIEIANETGNGPTDFQWKIRPETVNGKRAIQYTNSDSALIPEVKFMEEGRYNVTLIASNALGADTFSQQQFIRVKECYSTCNDMMSTKSEGFLFDSAGRDVFVDEEAPASCAFTIDPSCTDSIVANLRQLKIGGNFASGIRDNLKIYDGTSTSAPAIHDRLGYGDGFYEGNAPSSNQPIVARSGAMTVVLNTNGEDGSEDFVLEWDGKQSPSGGLQQAIDDIDLDAPDTAFTSGVSTFQVTNPVRQTQYQLILPGFNKTVSQDSIIPVRVSGVDPGTYQVELIAQRCGYADTVKEMVYFRDVNEKPVAQFTASNTTPTEGDTVIINDLSRAGIETYQWQFQPSAAVTYVNGTDSSSVNPAVVIAQAGDYRVDLIVSNKAGRSIEAKLDYLTVKEPRNAGCEPVVNQQVKDLSINQFSVYNANGDLLYTNSSGYSSSGYGQFESASELSLAAGREYIFEIERNTAFNDFGYGVWLDLNQDGNISRSEALFTNRTDSGFSVKDTVTIPKASPGEKTLRVATNVSGSRLSGCGPHQAGEFEDYSVDYQGDIDPPSITLKGGNSITVDVCNPAAADTGATAMDAVDGDISNQVELRNASVLNKPGTYTLPYVVTDEAGNRATKTQTITVTPDNVDPQVALNGPASLTIDLDEDFQDPGFSVSDACGKVDTVLKQGTVNTGVIGRQMLRYIAVDFAGNKDTAIRAVQVTDPVAPDAQLVGSDTVKLPVFGNYGDPGIVSSDNYRDSTIVEVNGSVNTDSVGVYNIAYEVADLDTNITTLTRTVIVEDTKAPQFSDIPENAVVLPVNQPIDVPFNVSDNYYEASDLQVERTGGYFEAFADGVADSLGTYTARFEVTDGSGNMNAFSIAVEVVDRTAPNVTLNQSVVNINRFGQFLDSLGETYQVTDNYYDAVNIIVNRYGTYFKEYMQGGQSSGVYEIRYKATDPAGNESQPEVRTVNVREKTTGIGDESGEMAVEVYPNPTNGPIRVELADVRQGPVMVQVINAKGQTVREISRQVTGNMGDYNVDLGNEAKGLYKVKVQASDQVVSESIVVQ